MTQHRQKLAFGLLGLFLLVIISGGCCHTQQMTDSIKTLNTEQMADMLGKDVAEYRARGKGQSCPTIQSVHVSPKTVECGNEVSLTITALAPDAEEVYYSWEIDGEVFDSGPKAIWKTPTCKSFKDPQQLYTIRGTASDGECSMVQSFQVQVLCDCPLDLMVNFEFGKADLDGTARAILDELGSTLNNYPSYSVLIEGHTDYIGTNPSNQALGERRAEAVKEYLVTRWDVQPERFMTMSFGEESPIAPNETDKGRAQNRRAEIFRIRMSGD
jgi:outer membrane protein OmpA-like peptidoglycan-associated protein